MFVKENPEKKKKKKKFGLIFSKKFVYHGLSPDSRNSNQLSLHARKMILNTVGLYLIQVNKKDRTAQHLPKNFSFSKVPVLAPANIYLFKVKNRNARKRCEICSKLRLKAPNNVINVVLVCLLITLKTF